MELLLLVLFDNIFYVARMQKLRDIQGTNYQDVQFVLNAVNAVVAVRSKMSYLVNCTANCLWAVSPSPNVDLLLWILP